MMRQDTHPGFREDIEHCLRQIRISERFANIRMRKQINRVSIGKIRIALVTR